MADDDFITEFNQVNHCGCCLIDMIKLFSGIIAEGITAKGDDDSFHCSFLSALTPRSSGAFAVYSRSKSFPCFKLR